MAQHCATGASENPWHTAEQLRLAASAAASCLGSSTDTQLCPCELDSKPSLAAVSRADFVSRQCSGDSLKDNDPHLHPCQLWGPAVLAAVRAFDLVTGPLNIAAASPRQPASLPSMHCTLLACSLHNSRMSTHATNAFLFKLHGGAPRFWHHRSSFSASSDRSKRAQPGSSSAQLIQHGVLTAPSTPSQVAPAQERLLVGQGCAALQIGLDLPRVHAKGAVDLLVEVRIAVVDEVHVLVRVNRPPAHTLG